MPGENARLAQSPHELREMIVASGDQPDLYRPGPFWAAKAEAATQQILRQGLDDFRGEQSALGTSFSDNLFGDVRPTLDTRRGRLVKFVLEHGWPLSAVFDAQVNLTRGYARDEVALRAARAAESATAQELMSRFTFRDSLRGGCIASTRIDGQQVSLHHLRTAQLIDEVGQRVDLNSIERMMEIGGGFGVLEHLLLDNLPQLKKVVYLDVIPNLYVGACYLRTLFGDSVRPFVNVPAGETISFRDDDSREILVIAPWQIEQLDLGLDLFWNANSFVEMPRAVAENYARRVLALDGSADTAIVLATYGGGDSTTLSPDDLPALFAGRQFERGRFHVFDNPTGYRVDPERDAVWDRYLYVSSGAHAQPRPSSDVPGPA